MNKINRIAEKGFSYWLNKGKALVITGARQVGKTTMLQGMFGSREDVLWLNADQIKVRQRLEQQDILVLRNLIGNYKTVVIDEVQRISNAGLLLKLLVDNFKDVQVIATGSSALDISETIFEPLTGRHLLFHLYPFSMAELYTGKSPFEIEQQLPFHLVYGNYPEVCLNKPDAEILLKNLANQYLYKDVLVWKDLRKPDLLDKLLKLLAWQIGNEVSVHELAKQLQVKSETLENYIDLLEKSFVVYRLHAYTTNPRKEVTKKSKIYFWDNGIRNALIDNFNDIGMRGDVGALWENFIISERMKMNAWKRPNVKSHFWRNYNQSEVDYVEIEKKQIRAYEMKWGTLKKQYVSKAFIHLYPDAETNIITPSSFYSFAIEV